MELTIKRAIMIHEGMTKIAWRLRWLMLFSCLLSLFILNRADWLLRPEIFVPFCILAIYNLVAGFVSPKPSLCYAESLLDTIFITALIFWTGGEESIFFLFYLMVIMLAGLYYRPLSAFLLTLGVTGIYILFSILSENSITIPYLILKVYLFFGFASITSYLSSELWAGIDTPKDTHLQVEDICFKLRQAVKTLESESKKLSELYNISLRLEANGNIGEVVEATSSLLGSQLNLVSIFDEKTNRLKIEASEGISADFLSGVRKGEGLIGKVIETGNATVINGLSKEKGPDYLPYKNMGIESLALFPLSVPDGTYGALVCGFTEPKILFPQERKFLSLMGNILAFYLENRNLHGEIKKLSITDDLSTLYTRPYFVNALKKELERSRYLKRCFSIVALEPDGAHQKTTDLQRLGLLIRSAIRGKEDIAARENERFYIFLSGTREDGAMIMVERLKKMFQEKGIEARFGLATYPPDVDGHKELLDRAKKRLEEGR
ncbi:MAG: GAF domain-containing protein [bacterium]